MARIPRLSHLQFLVLGALRGRELAGREVRVHLEGFGVHKSGPAFYQLMARLEDAGLVRGRYRQEVVEGQIIRERLYVASADGLRAWDGSRDFYLRAIEEADGLGSPARA